MRMLVLLFTNFITFAQIANPSIFSATKSINPAVVSGRKMGQITFLGTHDQLEKEQDLAKTFGDGSTAKTITKMQQYSFFSGGKGGGLTCEVNLKKVEGDVNASLDTSSGELESVSGASSMGASILIGLNKSFGIGFSYTNFKRSYADNFKVTGTEYKTGAEINRTFKSIKPGFRLGSNSFRVGAYSEYILQSGTSTNTNYNEGKNETTLKSVFDPLIIIGIGVGFQRAGLNIEVAYETMPFVKEEGGLPSPSRRSILIEGKVLKFTLGYKGSFYQGTFTDLENILSSQLLYPISNERGRFEHAFNFAIGSDRGLSFGGSAFISKTKTEEKSNFGNEDVPTMTDSFGFSVRVGYVF